MLKLDCHDVATDRMHLAPATPACGTTRFPERAAATNLHLRHSSADTNQTHYSAIDWTPGAASQVRDLSAFSHHDWNRRWQATSLPRASIRRSPTKTSGASPFSIEHAYGIDSSLGSGRLGIGTWRGLPVIGGGVNAWRPGLHQGAAGSAWNWMA